MYLHEMFLQLKGSARIFSKLLMCSHWDAIPSAMPF
jgi:hypothetical protein